MANKSFTTTAIRFAYLHGFASSPLSTKGVQLREWFQDELNISLDLPDLNIPCFRKQCLSKMIDHVEKNIIESNSIWFLIGSSFGGLVSTLVTQRQPKLIHSLLLLAPAFNPVERWMSKFNIEQWKNIGFMNHFNPMTQSDEPIDYEFFRDLQTYPSYPIVTTCPITIIHGLHDDIIPIETSREYMQKLRLLNKHPRLMIEVDDDHYLRKKKTINTIKTIILDSYK
ncbi:unnamed protein product [Rotaria sp. Silwood1]|nr:unnamed protein product [Rotaria sp. Silwood1]CAF3684204.1 unnamed protein product [Rotaria sp. Silwood1]CAF3734296.1 unnamed protein product [Rotaria sp. Silwood1]CAF4508887.1 unnamed protein product [Rotaria sp. Silwood1]CAF5126645.1 unnamed protein product [Rotaria sp. Silwood1]